MHSSWVRPRTALLAVTLAAAAAVGGCSSGSSAGSGSGSSSSTATSSAAASTISSAGSSAAGPSTAYAYPSPVKHKIACTRGVRAEAWQRVEPDGSHSAAIQYYPCSPGPAKPYSVAPGEKLFFQSPDGEHAPVPIRHIPSVRSWQSEPPLPGCFQLRWPKTPVGEPVTVAEVGVIGIDGAPTLTFRLPMTVGATSGIDKGGWTASSGECLGSN